MKKGCDKRCGRCVIKKECEAESGALSCFGGYAKALCAREHVDQKPNFCPVRKICEAVTKAADGNVVIWEEKS